MFHVGESGGTRVIQKGFSSKRRNKVHANDDTSNVYENGDEKESVNENGENDENVDENVGENDESPSFYVADDEKSIAVVDLLLESKDKRWNHNLLTLPIVVKLRGCNLQINDPRVKNIKYC